MSRRSSLAALSLAATAVRPIGSKDQKDSTKGLSATDAAAALKLRKEAVRHHLDRTTGSSEQSRHFCPRQEWRVIKNIPPSLPVAEDGALLPSPTIDKLMPALPRSREGSPKKTITSRHGSPQKGSPKKLASKLGQKGRSQSVGANHVDANGTTQNGSPKRQLRSAITIEDVKDGGVTMTVAPKPAKDTKVTINVPGERRPRPSK